MNRILTLILALLLAPAMDAQEVHPDSHYVQAVQRLCREGLGDCRAYEILEELTRLAPGRLGGSPAAERAVALMQRRMEALAFDNVHRESVSVPVWTRGPVEDAKILGDRGGGVSLAVCALGGSIATPPQGITAEVVEVHSFDELRALGPAARGKIVFFNRPFDASLVNTFAAYAGAVDQRGGGAVAAARAGGVAALVRSMTHAVDDVPHTGYMGYSDTIPKVPAAAVGIVSAETLSARIHAGLPVRVRLRLSCAPGGEAPSANVVGEITGTEHPEEVVLVGSHLDSWDKGSGAHDDGAGCAQAIEVIRLLNAAGLHPKRTVRAVLFMNEENGLRGGKAYVVAPERAGEKHIAAMESDEGGFAPVGVSVQSDSAVVRKVLGWAPLFKPLLADRFVTGYSGVDVSPLVKTGVPGLGLNVETQRYFDYHHSDNDTIDKVNRRELELGAIVEALMCYLIAEEGL